MDGISDNLRRVLTGVRAAAEKSGRDPSSVRLVVVTKTVPAIMIAEAVRAGAEILGENRVQEALHKMQEPVLRAVRPAPEWHLIGTLQKNKARYAVGSFSLIHSVDGIELAREIDRQAGRRGIVQDGLLEVNVAGEGTKHGVRPEDVLAVLKESAFLKNIWITGLMCVPPITEDPETSRPYFKTMREILSEVGKAGLMMTELSMGMSQDYEVATEEGATLVRVGTAIFGSRV
ncbi:MAG: YggS family pyridoxal phosphate-dependent enzyme [Nitrospirota bacterium]